MNQLKGAGALDWGMQSRLARVFAPGTNRTVMLAIDHGYFQGPTTGLERVDLSQAVSSAARRARRGNLRYRPRALVKGLLRHVASSLAVGHNEDTVADLGTAS